MPARRLAKMRSRRRSAAPVSSRDVYTVPEATLSAVATMAATMASSSSRRPQPCWASSCRAAVMASATSSLWRMSSPRKAARERSRLWSSSSSRRASHRQSSFSPATGRRAGSSSDTPSSMTRG